MPAWWKQRSNSKSKAKKSSSASDLTPKKQPEESEGEVNCSLAPKHCRETIKEKANSFDGIVGVGRANDHVAIVAPNRGDGESKGVFAFDHPLPRPFVSSPLLSPPPLDLGTVAASCLASASSVSSSGSSDDTHDHGFSRIADPMNMSRGARALMESRRHQHVAETRHLVTFNPVLEQSINAIVQNPAATYSECIFNPKL